jgi:solute carrier family 25 phosphate transporter 23/24/25/41
MSANTPRKKNRVGLFGEISQENLTYVQMVAGGMAGAITKTCIAPLERIKILFQIQGMKEEGRGKDRMYRNSFQTAGKIFREEGVLSFYKGNGANVVRVVPVYALKFAFNDTFKAMMVHPGQSLKTLDLGQRMGAGTMAGLCQSCITYPLEVVRTRLALGPGMGIQYKGIVDCLLRIVRDEKIRGLYKGLGPTILSGAPYVGMQMTLYAEFTNRFGKESILQKLTNGALAGVVAQTLTYPGDTIRRQMQSDGIGGQPKIYRNMFHCAKLIFQNQGIVGFFRGAPLNCARAIPGAAIQFTSYDFLKKVLGC